MNKKNIQAIAIGWAYSAIILTGVFASELFGVVHLGRVALFLLLVQICGGLAMIGAKKMEPREFSNWWRFDQIIVVLTLVSFGWWVTAICYAVVAVCFLKTEENKTP